MFVVYHMNLWNCFKIKVFISNLQQGCEMNQLQKNLWRWYTSISVIYKKDCLKNKLMLVVETLFTGHTHTHIYIHTVSVESHSHTHTHTQGKPLWYSVELRHRSQAGQSRRCLRRMEGWSEEEEANKTLNLWRRCSQSASSVFFLFVYYLNDYYVKWPYI